jgi:hypothetical protein
VLLELAKCYTFGIGTKQDIKKAYEIYLKISKMSYDGKISPIEKYILSEPKKSEIDALEMNSLPPSIFSLYMLADLHFDNFIKIDLNLNYEDLFEEQKKLDPIKTFKEKYLQNELKISEEELENMEEELNEFFNTFSTKELFNKFSFMEIRMVFSLFKISWDCSRPRKNGKLLRMTTGLK